MYTPTLHPCYFRGFEYMYCTYYMAHGSVHKMARSDWLVTGQYFRVRTCEMDPVRWTARNIAHATLCLDFVNLLLWSFLMSDDSEHSKSEFYYPNETEQVPQKESDQDFLANKENVDSLAKFRFIDEQQAPKIRLRRTWMSGQGFVKIRTRWESLKTYLGRSWTSYFVNFFQTSEKPMATITNWEHLLHFRGVSNAIWVARGR